MSREDVSQLYSALAESRFRFIPAGRHSLPVIYDYVQQKYPDLCDDAYLCADNCKDGHNRPEWKHRVRAAIWDAKDRSDYVSRDSSRGYWCFGDTTENDSLPQEAASSLFTEGHSVQVTINRYERSAKARLACVSHHGYECGVCGIRLRDVYGDVADGFIHVHHLNPISLNSDATIVDPIEDLRPVCPNCHAIIHLRNPPYSILEVQQMVTSPAKNTEQVSGGNGG